MSSTSNSIKNVLITGGAGYVGAVLAPKLLAAGYKVTVLDWFIFGKDVLDSVKSHWNLKLVQGDIRDQSLLRSILPGCDAVIHLACISNDPSFELDPTLGKSVNFDAFGPLVVTAKACGVRRFIYASSSSVYGVSDQPNVTEDHPLNPITDYSRFKAMCEPVLLHHNSPAFVAMVVRPATVCGYSPRQRLDLSVNILTNHAVNQGKLTIFGGSQLRPNIHIQDMTDLYIRLLEEPEERIAGKIFNAGYENLSIDQIGQAVADVVRTRVPGRENLQVVRTPTDDIRSYHISSAKIARELGFTPRRSVRDAVIDLVHAFAEGLIPDPLNDIRYYNIKTMQRVRPLSEVA